MKRKLAYFAVVLLYWQVTAQAQVSEIGPSGDASGMKDAQTVQAALDGGGLVVLSGPYWIDKPLTYGSAAKPAQLSGKGPTSIYYVGPLIESAAINVAGTGSSLRNLSLFCGYKSRGVRCQVTSSNVASDLRIREARQIALDMHDCWGGNLRDIQIWGCHGTALRAYRCNAARYEAVHINGCNLFWHSAADKNKELWEYGGDNGMAATRTKYKADCLEDWATEDEIPVVDRACIAILGDTMGIAFNQLRMEPVACADYPAVSCHASTARFSQVYFESGYFNDALFQVTGTADGLAGANVTFEYIATNWNAKPPAFAVKLLGTRRT